MVRLLTRLKPQRPPRTRYYTREEFERLVSLDPGELARSEIAACAEIMAREPKWDWPKVCHQFAADALRLLENPHTDSAEVGRVCADFRHDGAGVKGIFGLWYLHDYLLEQVESRSSPKQF